MTTQTKPDKWERRRQRQAFLNGCAKLKTKAPQINALTARKLWDRAAAEGTLIVESKTAEANA